MSVLAGSGISASKAEVLSCGKEGSHLLVASSAEILNITQQSLGQASMELFKFFREKPPLIPPSTKLSPLCFITTL